MKIKHTWVNARKEVRMSYKEVWILNNEKRMPNNEEWIINNRCIIEIIFSGCWAIRVLNFPGISVFVVLIEKFAWGSIENCWKA